MSPAADGGTGGGGPPAPRHVSVVGGYDVDDGVLADAEQVGRLAAAAGLVVVTGGRGGVSAAACRGASGAGGTAIGILPGTDRAEANPWCTHTVLTGLGDTRNALVAMNGDAVVALGGAWGTLSEIAHARLLGRPVVGLGTWAPAPAPGGDAGIHRVATPGEAIEVVLARLGA